MIGKPSDWGLEFRIQKKVKKNKNKNKNPKQRNLNINIANSPISDYFIALRDSMTRASLMKENSSLRLAIV